MTKTELKHRVSILNRRLQPCKIQIAVRTGYCKIGLAYRAPNQPERELSPLMSLANLERWMQGFESATDLLT